MGYAVSLPYGDYFTIGTVRPADFWVEAAGTDMSLGSIIIPSDMKTIKAVYIDWYWTNRIDTSGAPNNITNSCYIMAEYGGVYYAGIRVMPDQFPTAANAVHGAGALFGYTDCKAGFRPGHETYISMVGPIATADYLKFYNSQIVAKVITY